MAWEATLFRKTRLGAYKHCLALVEANAEYAPLWERCCLAAFAGIGPVVGRLFNADTASAWERADKLIADLFAVSRMSPRQVAGLLRQYINIKLEETDHLPFEEARTSIYEQLFYPVVTHFTFALQPSAVARLKYIREAVSEMPDERRAFADLGCGSGVILCEVLATKKNWKGFGLDISPNAVSYALRLAAHKGLAGRAEVSTGDIANLPYENASLDLVIASEVIEHMPEPEQVVKEIARVLRPGGKLIMTMPVESHTPAHIHTLNDAEDFRALCEVAGLNVRQLKPQWHLGFGDDPRHIFALVDKPVWTRDEVFETDAALEPLSAFASWRQANSLSR
ncbi:MAG TPA: class I SAM-dependent methyltransferase [Pyrinomonadaceae bacterium]|jgi:ubiquinone/menaquinone biosynthesis C-methylase UbiE